MLFGEAIEDQKGATVKVRVDTPEGEEGKYLDVDLFVASMDGSGHPTLKKKGDQVVIFNPFFDLSSAFVGFCIPKKSDLDKGEKVLINDGKNALSLSKEGDLKFTGRLFSKDVFAGPFEAPPPEPNPDGSIPEPSKEELFVSLGKHKLDPSKGNIPLPEPLPPDEAPA